LSLFHFCTIVAEPPHRGRSKYGIPAEFRSEIWVQISGAQDKQSKEMLCYRHLVEQFVGQKSTATVQIEKDLGRTLPYEPHLQTEEGLSALRRVLCAYSWFNPAVGYCQSMNFVAGILLSTLTEENTFWVMRATIEDFLPNDYYTNSMLGVRVDELVFEELVLWKLPKIASHLEECECSAGLFALRWFLCLFIGVLPTETVLRILDLFFTEGDKIMFRIGLALLKLNEKLILETVNQMELIELFSKVVPKVEDTQKLIKVAFSFDPLNRSKIRSLRHECLQRLMEDSEFRENANDSEVVEKFRPKSWRINFREIINLINDYPK